MMSTKHTAGPWTYGRVGNDERKDVSWWIGTPHADIAHISRMDDTGKSLEEHDANAARIVACVNGCENVNPEAVPLLVHALKNLLEHDDGEHNGCDADPCDWCFARQALAKAAT